MDINKRLTEIWSKDYIGKLPALVKDRKYVYAENRAQKDVLVTGINPSFREGEQMASGSFDFDQILKHCEFDSYFCPIKTMIGVGKTDVNLSNRTAYLDIFYYRDPSQGTLRNKILKTPDGVGIRFLVDQLNLTQHVLEEVINPKVVVVKNKESAAYWGKLADNGLVWMGYDFEPIVSSRFGDVCRIKGLLNSPERIAPEITKTNLENTLVLFTQHITQFTSKEKRPTPEFINLLLNYNNQPERIRDFV